MQAHEAWAGDHALGGYAAVGAFEMPPDLLLLRADRTEIRMANLGRERQELAANFSECGGAEPGARPEHEAQTTFRRRNAADVLGPFRQERRQRQRLRLEIVEQQ